MKIRYKGPTTIPLAMAIGTIPAVTNGKIYEVILDNEDSDYYVIIDDENSQKVMKKELCRIIENKGDDDLSTK